MGAGAAEGESRTTQDSQVGGAVGDSRSGPRLITPSAFGGRKARGGREMTAERGRRRRGDGPKRGGEWKERASGRGGGGKRRLLVAGAPLAMQPLQARHRRCNLTRRGAHAQHEGHGKTQKRGKAPDPVQPAKLLEETLQGAWVN